MLSKLMNCQKAGGLMNQPHPPMLMNDISKTNKVEGEFMLQSNSEMLTCKVRTLMRKYEICLIIATG